MMLKSLVLLLVVLTPVSALAVYNDATVVQVDPVTPQGTISITASFSGPGEVTVKHQTSLPWNYTDLDLANWSGGLVERLNGVKGLPTRIKAGDKLQTQKPQ